MIRWIRSLRWLKVLRFGKGGRRGNPDGTMPLIEHLYELRYRLALAFGALMIGAVIGFIWFDYGPGPIPTLSSLITGPYCSLPTNMRFQPNDGACQLMQTTAFEVVSLRIQLALASGAVLSSPMWLYQIWAFITPGLYSKERKFAGIFVGCASVLFIFGAVLAYLVAPEGLYFMASFGAGNFFTALTGGAYVGFILLLLLIFGISFELPLLVVMLNRAGILPYAKLKQWWRGIVFGLFVFAAFATPGQDPLSMVVLATALVLLFGAASQFARIHDKRKAKKLAAAGLAELDPDQASEIDTKPSELPKPDRYDDAT
ncbi:twin-arginine translocase subunit TatC [Actinoalloteichus hymeniacidonis]|uniref:Sec-independent protein translocase protein TatC n=1 Tax=Actinoalloteichus hymeniacidonis TaxID=340345 RepID=A0AAC9HNW8_9PSEU|nr:twin-arginine translocase subunit TatC [Actinoalloteichus hymeniacidonis]AOS62256.1 twin arginine targeting protein translocase subunit TatC [Actinoalloteichus hymeniacidonis]MBB5909718.1 sec-independent protein translocase protein TatC [Actinoalloteichus hymeniacidonis]